jgi:hypothetical protein
VKIAPSDKKRKINQNRYWAGFGNGTLAGAQAGKPTRNPFRHKRNHKPENRQKVNLNRHIQ